MVSMNILEAAEEGNVSALERFGRQAVNESVTDEFGSNCLHYAARNGCLEMINYLVNQLGFTGNKRSDIGATAAHDAAAAGQLDSLKWLLANTSCDFNDQDGCGSTVLHLACRFGHTPITDWLLETGQCNTEIRASSGGIPLHFAVVGGDRESIELLLDFEPSSVNYQLTNGATPTYLAAQEGQTDILMYLVQKRRGNIKMKAYDGMSCVHAAAQSGNLNCVKFLVEEEKYNPNERDFDGASPLHYAASQGHWEVIDWLMKVGGARVTLDNLGGSPLHNAAESNHLQCIRVLLNNGCSPDITDNNGLTAAELAVKCFHSNAATYIKNYSPQSQHFDDPDLDYLLAVQSPRPPPLKIVQQAPIGPPKAELISDYLELFPTTTNGPEFHTDKPVNREKPVNTVTKRSRSPVPRQSAHGFYTKGDRGSKDETDSILARADSSELLVGIPRSGSRDFSEICGSTSSRASGSSSSSSLSPQEYKYPESPVANGQKLLHHLPINSLKQRSSSVTIKKPEPQLNSPRSTSLYKRETKVEGKPASNIFSKLSSTRESRNVTFRSDVSEIRSRSNMESEEDERWRLEAYLSAVSGNNVVTKEEKAKEDTENNNRLSFSENLESKGPLVYDDEREAGVPLQDNSSVNKNKPVFNFTAEMMQNRRNSLVPAPVQTPVNKQGNTDFLEELKRATKAAPLRRSSVDMDASRQSVTPTMVFTAGHRKSVITKPVESKDMKLELIGEWDPKNFVDKVPNRDSLPAWKVQLQARHIAEKEMKETMEKQQIEERESRFKNMPPWKRALVEKKEAEAREAEEKIKLQKEQAPKVVRKTPKVSVMPTHVEKDGPQLAPWQLELQKKS